ncbi:MAG: hypothetical protein IH957_01695 [Chloroflexi bacterium]|nr:hypothetical protein [Chloroflexota bacterium]
MPNVALGFRAHTGWAVAVALGGRPEAPSVIDRRRLDLIDHALPRQVYHAVSRLDSSSAEKLVGRVRECANAFAKRAVQSLIDELKAADHAVVGIGVVVGGGWPVAGLARALSSHAAKHGAEGALYCDALIQAAEPSGLPVTSVYERDLYDLAAGVLRATPDSVRDRLTDLGRPMGAPWNQDYKRAALVAWLTIVARAADESSD